MPRETGNHGRRGASIRKVKRVWFPEIHRTFTVRLLASFRSALLICAALTASTIAPAEAGPTGGDTLVSVADATLAKVSVPELIDPNGQPQLSQPDAATPETPTDNQNPDEIAQPAIDRSEDLASMVADLRGPDASSRELECLATGVY